MKYILIADDEPLNQSIFEEMLIDDYEYEIVDDGQACLESVEKRIPDLILLDIAMPKVNGIEVCERLRGDEKTRNIPVILVSAYASKGDMETGMAVGANDYVTKPFEISDLLSRIERLLNN